VRPEGYLQREKERKRIITKVFRSGPRRECNDSARTFLVRGGRGRGGGGRGDPILGRGLGLIAKSARKFGADPFPLFFSFLFFF